MTASIGHIRVAGRKGCDREVRARQSPHFKPGNWEIRLRAREMLFVSVKHTQPRTTWRQLRRLVPRRPALPRAGAAIALGLAVLPLLARPWYTRWGTTGDETREPLPGDDFVPLAGSETTMAVTIDAPPEDVWPWLVQMGQDRAGFYTYTRVENGLLHLNFHNSDRIVPEWQNLKVGDHIWFLPAHYVTPRFGPTVARIEPERALILTLGELDQPVSGTWQFVLKPTAEGGTRLLFRQRGSATQPLAVRIPNLVMEPGYFYMERKMLLGIKERVERNRQSPPRIALAA